MMFSDLRNIVMVAHRLTGASGLIFITKVLKGSANPSVLRFISGERGNMQVQHSYYDGTVHIHLGADTSDIAYLQLYRGL